MGLRNKLKVWMLRKVINDQTLYDIISAIRGCDSYNTVLKYLFTARIRCLAGMNIDDAFADVRVDKEIKLWMIYRAVESVSEADIHYLEHITYAINALRRLKLIDEKEADMLNAIATILIDVAKRAIDRDTARKKIEELTKKYKGLIKPRIMV